MAKVTVTLTFDLEFQFFGTVYDLHRCSIPPSFIVFRARVSEKNDTLTHSLTATKLISRLTDVIKREGGSINLFP